VRVWVSAQQGLGLELVQQAMAERLGQDVIQESVLLEHAEARLRAQFYAVGAVVEERIADDGRQQLDLRLQRSDFNRLLKREGWLPDVFLQQHTLQ
jgi:GTPase